MVSRRIEYFLALVVGMLFHNGVQSFQSTQPRSQQFPPPATTRLHVVGVETIGIAVVSAMAGAAAQIPKIRQLEDDLADAKAALAQSKNEMISKIGELEEKLFQMDKQYEDQSAKFMKEYEVKKNIEVAKITDKMKTDFRYKLEIEVEKEKSRLLTKKLSDVSVVGDQTTKLAEMKIKMNQLENARTKLEQALAKTETELLRANASGQKKGGSWFF